MATRLPASERTREELRALIDGRLASSDARSALLRLATRLIVEEALETEVEDALGRGYYAHGATTGAGYRNGYRTGRLKTAEGPIAYAAPQVADRDEPFRSAIVLRFWRGLSPEQMAVELGVPRNTVRSRLQRGLERLRARLDAAYGERAKWHGMLAAFPRQEEAVIAGAPVSSPQ